MSFTLTLPMNRGAIMVFVAFNADLFHHFGSGNHSNGYADGNFRDWVLLSMHTHMGDALGQPRIGSHSFKWELLPRK